MTCRAAVCGCQAGPLGRWSPPGEGPTQRGDASGVSSGPLTGPPASVGDDSVGPQHQAPTPARGDRSPVSGPRRREPASRRGRPRVPARGDGGCGERVEEVVGRCSSDLHQSQPCGACVPTRSAGRPPGRASGRWRHQPPSTAARRSSRSPGAAGARAPVPSRSARSGSRRGPGGRAGCQRAPSPCSSSPTSAAQGLPTTGGSTVTSPLLRATRGRRRSPERAGPRGSGRQSDLPLGAWEGAVPVDTTRSWARADRERRGRRTGRDRSGPPVWRQVARRRASPRPRIATSEEPRAAASGSRRPWTGARGSGTAERRPLPDRPPVGQRRPHAGPAGDSGLVTERQMQTRLLLADLPAPRSTSTTAPEHPPVLHGARVRGRLTRREATARHEHGLLAQAPSLLWKMVAWRP